MKKLLRVIMVLGVTALSLAGSIQKAEAHSVQVAYCATCEAKLRLYIEHWHGTADPSTTTMTISVTIGATTITYTGSPLFGLVDVPFAQLPSCAIPPVVVAQCPGQANTYDDWVIYEFDSIQCNQPVTITILSGNTVFTQDGCSYMPLSIPNVIIPCGAIATAGFIPPLDTPLCASDSHQFINTTTPPQITNFVWDFGSGGNDTSFLKDPKWKYPGGGTYIVTLSAGDSLGCFDDTSIAVTIEDVPIPVWNWTMGCAPDYATLFHDSSWIASTGSITRYLWDFGIEGVGHDTSNLTDPQWTYPSGGPYNVTLYLWSQNGCMDSLQQQIQIGNQPWAAASWDTVCWEKGFPFHDLSTIIPQGNINQWTWDFGDGDTSHLQHPTHKFPTAGIYTVKMLVTSATGCQDSLQMVVEAYYEPPMVEPNVFTPNGDGKNDMYVIPEVDLHRDYLKYRGNAEEDQNMEFWVYNRWGREILHTQKYDNDWAGKTKAGKLLDDGTYYYIIKYNTYCYPDEGAAEESTVRIHKGTVTIIDGK